MSGPPKTQAARGPQAIRRHKVMTHNAFMSHAIAAKAIARSRGMNFSGINDFRQDCIAVGI